MATLFHRLTVSCLIWHHFSHIYNTMIDMAPLFHTLTVCGIWHHFSHINSMWNMAPFVTHSIVTVCLIWHWHCFTDYSMWNMAPMFHTLTECEPGRVAQSVTCLATDVCLTADPGVASSIPVRSHTFLEIDHEIISTVILLPSADFIQEGLLSVTSESMCTNYWLTACSSLVRKKCG